LNRSEYFGHQPGDDSGDVFFHLDPLWSDPEIDFVGIDNYMPSPRNGAFAPFVRPTPQSDQWRHDRGRIVS
jgi:hypothetical protein